MGATWQILWVVAGMDGPDGQGRDSLLVSSFHRNSHSQQRRETYALEDFNYIRIMCLKYSPDWFAKQTASSSDDTAV